jgi:hypothetical protein
MWHHVVWKKNISVLGRLAAFRTISRTLGEIQFFFIADFFRVLIQFKIKMNGIIDR